MFRSIVLAAVSAAWPMFIAVIPGHAIAGPIFAVAGQDALPNQKKKSAKHGEVPQPGAKTPERQAPRDDDGSDQDDSASPDADDVPGCLFKKAPLELLV